MSFWDNRRDNIGRHVHLPDQILDAKSGSVVHGSAKPIGVYLEANTPDAGHGNILWDKMWDINGQEITDWPEGIGIEFTPGSKRVLQTTEQGIWLLQLMATLTPDETAIVQTMLTLADYTGGCASLPVQPDAVAPFQLQVLLHGTAFLPAGGVIATSAAVATPAAELYDPVNYAVLTIVRVA
jgi:hypothetical protein